jgi:hypothetical protein
MLPKFICILNVVNLFMTKFGKIKENYILLSVYITSNSCRRNKQFSTTIILSYILVIISFMLYAFLIFVIINKYS